MTIRQGINALKRAGISKERLLDTLDRCVDQRQPFSQCIRLEIMLAKDEEYVFVGNEID